MSRPLRRRDFLKGAALAGAGAASLSFPSSFARAQSTPARPRRIVFLIAEQGWVYKNWRMRPPGSPLTLSRGASMDPALDNTPDNDSWEFDLANVPEDQWSVGMRPLYRHRARTLALDGLSMLTSSRDGFGDAHAAGYVASLTGAPAREQYDSIKSYASRPSVDQVITKALRDADPLLTDLTSLEFGVTPYYGSGGLNRFHHFLYGYNGSGPPVTVPAEIDPRAGFDRVFGSFTGGTQVDPITKSQADILALVGRQHARLRGQVVEAQKQKLETHRALVADLQSRIARLSQVVCTPPNRMVRMSGAEEEAMYRHNMASFFDLVGAAFGCDLSRVATIQCLDPPHTAIGTSGDLHHDFAHPSYPAAEFMTGEPHDLWLPAHEGMTRHLTFFAEAVAQLADKLESIPDGQGGTLLDSTMIVWVNELANGGHGHDQWPVVIVGGDAFRLGRWVRWPKNNPNPYPFNYGPQFYGEAHTKLLVSLCGAMGVPVDDFGLASVDGRVKAGPMRDVTKTITLGGPLDRLT